MSIVLMPMSCLSSSFKTEARATAFRGAPNERKSAFPTPGTAGFLKKACSRPREQAKTKKMSVPACGNEEK